MSAVISKGWSNGIHKLFAPIDGAPGSKSWSLKKFKKSRNAYKKMQVNLSTKAKLEAELTGLDRGVQYGRSGKLWPLFIHIARSSTAFDNKSRLSFISNITIRN